MKIAKYELKVVHKKKLILTMEDDVDSEEPVSYTHLLKFEADCSCDIPPNLTFVIKILYIENV